MQVCPLSEVTVFDVLKMLQLLMSSSNLSYATVVEIMKIINIVIGTKSLPESEYIFKKVCTKNINFNRKYFCVTCMKPITEPLIKNQKCASCDSVEKDFFIHIPIKNTLETILSSNFDTIKTWQNNVSNLDENLITDICNGEWYKSIKDVNNGDFFTININTDGVAVYSASKKKSLWPILITINELPKYMRFQKKFVLSAGYWLSEKSVDIDLFFDPFVEELNQMFEEGIEINNRKYKIIVGCCCLDSVARCKFLKIKQFNGSYGCTLCLHKATKQRYSYNETMILRTFLHYKECNEILSNLPKEKRSSTTDIKGVKGLTIMAKCKFYDLIAQCPPDTMHGVFLGVTKLFLKIWFDSSNHDKLYYIAPLQRSEIDKKLKRIQTYSECGRPPRPITDYKNWKANEFFNWLFYYSKYCLCDGILNPSHYRHFITFINIMETLHCGSITKENLNEMEKKLENFVKNFQILYDRESMVFDVHLLLHLPDAIRKFGPSQNYSLFVYENYNGVIGKFIKGPNGPLVQLAYRHFSYLSVYHYDKDTTSLKALEFCKQAMKKSSTIYRTTNDRRKYKEVHVEGKKYNSFEKYYIDHKTITTDKQSNKNKIYNDCFIEYKNNFFKIRKILIDENNSLFILGAPIATIEFSNLPNYYQICGVQRPIFKEIDSSFNKCFYYKFENDTESLTIIKNVLITD